MLNFEEGGLSEEGFSAERERAKKEIESYATKEQERPTNLYFKFDSAETRDRVIQVLNKLRDERGDYDERFVFFESCGKDPQRPNSGIEIRFQKNPPNLRRDFEQLLKNQELMPLEEYETVGGEPRPEETRINNTT